MLHLKKVFLLLFFTVAAVSFADAQNLTVRNNSCDLVEVYVEQTSSTCGPLIGVFSISVPPAVTQTFPIGSMIVSVRVHEGANPGNVTPHVNDPACGPSVEPFPMPFICNGLMYQAQLNTVGPDYFLTIF